MILTVTKFGQLWITTSMKPMKGLTIGSIDMLTMVECYHHLPSFNKNQMVTF